MPARILAILTLLLAFVSCHKATDDSGVLASVYGNKLTTTDIDGILGQGTSPEDSAVIVQNYINQWLLQQVVLEKARRNIQNDFSAELQNYKNSLLIYEYEQMIVAQMLDTVVSDEEIEQYYRQHLDNFALKSNIVKAIYIKVPKGCRTEPRIRRVFTRHQFSDADIMELQRLAATDAAEYYFDLDSWIPFMQLQKAVPIETYNEALYLRNNRNITISDEHFSYYAHVFDYRVTDEVSPLELERDNIRTVIINGRKIEIIKSMQRELLKEAQNAGKLYINS
ncbi:MAG: hypothetical protein IJU81_05740 [Bacteroidales bacterium]|nr:hypothetical protein [Bacteroidales bacterium]